jgi:hypothetical protein
MTKERTATYDANVIYADVQQKSRLMRAPGARKARAENLIRTTSSKRDTSPMRSVDARHWSQVIL